MISKTQPARRTANGARRDRTGSATAGTGSWVPGPGADSFAAAEAALGGLPLIAEDLGLITPEVVELRDRFRLPGMRVLQFASDDRGDNPHLPSNYAHNTVVYAGTHDNPTTRAWFEALPDQQRQNMWNYQWRCTAATLTSLVWRWLRDLTLASDRVLAVAPNPGPTWKAVIATKSAVLGRPA